MRAFENGSNLHNRIYGSFYRSGVILDSVYVNWDLLRYWDGCCQGRIVGQLGMSRKVLRGGRFSFSLFTSVLFPTGVIVVGVTRAGAGCQQVGCSVRNPTSNIAGGDPSHQVKKITVWEIYISHFLVYSYFQLLLLIKIQRLKNQISVVSKIGYHQIKYQVGGKNCLFPSFFLDPVDIQIMLLNI